MAFFALPDVMPPMDGHKTPFHGLDMTQFQSLMSIEDQIFNAPIENPTTHKPGIYHQHGVNFPSNNHADHAIVTVPVAQSYLQTYNR